MSFKDIIGQDKAIDIICGTIAKNRVPSAYLFAGESGIGKKVAAINLAKTINCLKTITNHELRVTSKNQNQELRTQNSEPIDSCDECASCRKIDAGTHSDLVVITPEKGEIRVGEIRAVGEALSYRPYEGRKKVVIIDDADAMNQSAANAFLKTLEEPPDESLVILITARPDRLPETIRSRCARINFVPLSSGSCKKVIRNVYCKDKKEPEVDDSVLSTIVKLSMGKPGLAISSDIVKDRERFICLFRSMLNGGNETWTDREEMEQWFDLVFILMRDMAVLKIMEKDEERNSVSAGHAYNESILFNSDIAAFVSDVAGKKDMMNIINIYDKLTFLKGLLDFNLNKAITWNYTASIVKGGRQ